VDGIGELLVVGCRGGHVLVNDVQGILEAAAEAAAEAGDRGDGADGGGTGTDASRPEGEKIVEPGLHLRVGDWDSETAVHAVRWNPVDQNEIAVLSSNSVAMYDVNRTRGAVDEGASAG